MNRRLFLKRGLQGAVLAGPALVLASQPPSIAQAAWNGHLQIQQRTGEWLTLPSGRSHHIMVWPDDSPLWTPPAGWISADRTEVLLKLPGIYRYEWRLTMNPNDGPTVKTASEYWDGTAWRDWGDGNQTRPSTDDNETTLLGWGWAPSNGRNKIRIGAYQDSGDTIRTSDRNYECALHVWKTS